MQQKPTQIVFTDKARCRDCYRCVRACPVKAIGVKDGQAFVVEGRCIACGTCIRECPQGAKAYRNDLERVVRLLETGGPVAASIAPSFAVICADWAWKRLPSALRKLGFGIVAETAVGAYHVARKTAEIVAREPDRSHICTACPAVVSYVEKYQPDLVKALVPVVSPMLAHAAHLKEKHGPGTKVVFIGPCIAKKTEAERPENAGLVDAALTFNELFEWFERAGIDLQACEESDFDEQPAGHSRFFPLPGGLARTASLHTDLLAEDCVAASGYEEVREILRSVREDQHPRLIEPLFCPQGCIDGAGIASDHNLYGRKISVLDYARRNPGTPPRQDEPAADLGKSFVPGGVDDARFSDEQIRKVLEQTGKVREEDYLNCGSCGYASCRDKAIAVLQGLAELDMCIPYMRRLAEQRTDRICETSPNGIVMLDDRLSILSMNPAFRKFFSCSNAVCGRRISYLMDPEPFERLASTDEPMVTVTVRHEKYNLICHEILYPLPQEKQYVGIFVNITSSLANEEKLRELRSQTARQARELLEHQVQMAQKMAQFLGQSTAHGEELVRNLLMLASDPKAEKDNRWLWDIYTSK
jgi:iron only hydrogenase large subunit-like protein/uncharacterized Fe-S cluster-containing protein